MKISRLIILMSSTCLLLAGAAAQAQGIGGHHRGDRQGGPGAGGPQRAMMMLRAADANADNTITRAEVDALQAEMFAWMDRNSDGYLDGEDASPVRQRLRALHEAEADEAGEEGRRWRRRAHGGDGPGDGPDGAGPGRHFDTDEDGRISRAEFLGGENRLFAMLDANEDGAITPDELDAAAERRQDRRHWWRN
ncbi:EF-hand domain-containing protein [Maricaulis sp.]|uniref:EF-hand domain-containing protein n=1 Tax=Maricaulis sp. TaxID=1486257 RepID=UPI0025C5B6F7|nr:EF-hand domain-containing protein [Maricaulis sp.]